MIWGLKGNISGSLTLPSISQADLDKMSAAYMKGSMGLIGEGEAEIGYLFGSEKWFKMSSHKFSGMYLYGSLGVGTGFAGEIAGNTINGQTVNMHINIKYAPVLSLGIGTKAYFLNSRLSTGLWLGTKIIADTAPEYFAYADDPSLQNLPEAGEIIVDDWMMKNMNPASFSIKLDTEYHQPINKHVELSIGGFSRFNIYTPKYITMPKTLLDMMNAQLKKDGKPEFSTHDRLKSFFLNSLEFGITIGLIFKT